MLNAGVTPLPEFPLRDPLAESCFALDSLEQSTSNVSSMETNTFSFRRIFSLLLVSLGCSTAIAEEPTLYVANYGNLSGHGYLAKFTLAGLGGSFYTDIFAPYGLALDSQGNL